MSPGLTTEFLLEQIKDTLCKQTDLMEQMIRDRGLRPRNDDELAELYRAAVSLNAVRAMLPRIEDLEVRADFAELTGTPYTITPEEPDPGRRWSRVQGHLFKPSGKWMYRVWLDYTGERFDTSAGYDPGVGPHGWHFDGAAMAKRALHRATTNGTSEVTISALGAYWHLFVQYPPQGFPIWVHPEGWTNDPVLAREQEAAGKLDSVRVIVEDDDKTMRERINMIRTVLDQ